MKRLTFGQEEPELSIISVAQEVLVLLARAGGGGEPSASPRVFECKTCNRRFPSFQALGGHRASHKRQRPRSQETAAAETEEPAKARAHGCAVCGVEFALGQALGGHMRRHRAMVEEDNARAQGPAEVEAERKTDEEKDLLLLSLDLNLAPP